MTQLPIEDGFRLAIEHHRAGRLPEAESLYRQILAQRPEDARALHLLGLVGHQTGRGELALELIRRAAELSPQEPEFHSNLGVILAAQNHLSEAIAAFRQALALLPNYPEAHNNLGTALRDSGQYDAAIAAFQQAIALHPHYAGAWSNLGLALHKTGRLQDAADAYRRAIALEPRAAISHNNLGNVLRETGDRAAAIAAYHQAIALNPNYALALYNLGVALKEEDQIDAAIAAYKQALSLDATMVNGFINLGVVLTDVGRLDEALASLTQALTLDPQSSEARINLARVYVDMARLDDALAACRHVLAATPGAGVHSTLAFLMAYHPECDAAAIAGELARWNIAHAQPLQPSIQPHANDRSVHRRLRIGYVSSDFRDHPVGRFLVPLFAHHDRQQVEIFAYAQPRASDGISSRLHALADVWRDIGGLSDPQVADLVRNDKIDILVDLALHSAGNRLLVLARKPAPVQVTFAGYPGSTGLPAIDYRLTDPHLDPPGLREDSYTETSVRLPASFWCFDPLEPTPDVAPTSPAVSRHITFGCLNNFCKVNDRMLELWAQILGAVAGSELLLLAKSGSHRQRTRDFLAARGVAADRVRFADRVPRPAYLELYRQFDISLDTVPYNGHTTTIDSLWMGVPVVTLVGNTVVGRGGLSILRNVGLPELAAETQDDYVRLAVDLARDLPRLSQLHRDLRGRLQASPLMNAATFARDLEAIYRAMWTRWCVT